MLCLIDSYAILKKVFSMVRHASMTAYEHAHTHTVPSARLASAAEFQDTDTTFPTTLYSNSLSRV